MKGDLLRQTQPVPHSVKASALSTSEHLCRYILSVLEAVKCQKSLSISVVNQMVKYATHAPDKCSGILWYTYTTG